MAYLLFGFSDGNIDVFTRGETEEQAMEGASRSVNFRRGSTIYPLNSVPLFVKEEYDKTHPFNWLEQPMRWLQEKHHGKNDL